MRKIGSTDFHSRPLGAVIYGQIYNFGGNTNKPINKKENLIKMMNIKK